MGHSKDVVEKLFEPPKKLALLKKSMFTTYYDTSKVSTYTNIKVDSDVKSDEDYKYNDGTIAIPYRHAVYCEVTGTNNRKLISYTVSFDKFQAMEQIKPNVRTTGYQDYFREDGTLDRHTDFNYDGSIQGTVSRLNSFYGVSNKQTRSMLEYSANIQLSDTRTSILYESLDEAQGTYWNEAQGSIASWALPQFYDKKAMCLYLQGLSDDIQGWSNVGDSDDSQDGDGTPVDDTVPMPNDTCPQNPLAVKGGNNYYLMQPSGVNAIVNYMWNNMLTDDLTDFIKSAVTKLYNSLNQCLVGVKIFPLDLNDYVNLSATNLTLGRFVADNISLQGIDSYKKTTVSLGKVKLNPFYNTFVDYVYNKVYIYLPFVGVRELNSQVVFGKEISVDYVIDVIVGNAECQVRCNGYLLASYECTLSVDIPITSDNYQASVATASASMFKGVARGVGSGNLVAGVSEVLQSASVASSQLESNVLSSGSVSSAVSFNSILDAYLIINVATYSVPSTYGKNVGFPCYRSYNLKELSGFTKIENPKLTWEDSSVKPTLDEINELTQLLQEGVIL